MVRSVRFAPLVRLAAAALALMPFFAVTPAFAARDRTPPTKPSNLRVTAMTAYQTALAWNPSSDSSGSFSYRVVISTGAVYTVAQNQTTFTAFTAPNSTYSYYVYAVDGAGNKSARSNTVSATTPADTTPPTAPVLTLIDANPTEASLAWSASTDDGPYLLYQVYVNGSPNVDAGTSRAAVVSGLAPATTYQLTVRARDFYGGNVSAPSNAISVTTPASDPNDVEPPSPVTNLFGNDFGCAEVWLSWTEAFDNQTPQASLRYEVFVNGVLDHTLAGGDRTIVYGTINGDNTFTLITLDSAGNRSEPAALTLPLVPCGP